MFVMLLLMKKGLKYFVMYCRCQENIFCVWDIKIMDCVVVYKMEGNVSYSLYSLNLFMIFYVKN